MKHDREEATPFMELLMDTLPAWLACLLALALLLAFWMYAGASTP